jgi:hypothetical protein
VPVGKRHRSEIIIDGAKLCRIFYVLGGLKGSFYTLILNKQSTFFNPKTLYVVLVILTAEIVFYQVSLLFQKIYLTNKISYIIIIEHIRDLSSTYSTIWSAKIKEFVGSYLGVLFVLI